ncbi:MAG: hypothetical protein KGI37_10445 [Alphaproteobacteria bacterium]|nr:hypothetical protein [Alphaproteobacteria bacterium]
MLNFDQYVMRHGEFGVQAIIEQIERSEGIHPNTCIPLEKRWESLMRPANDCSQPAMQWG